MKGDKYEEIGYYFANDILELERARLRECIKNKMCPKNLRNVYEYQLFAVRSAQDSILESVEDGQALPAYIIIETLAAFYGEASANIKLISMSQRYSIMADYLLNIRDQLKYWR